MKCSICGYSTKKYTNKTILKKYKVDYFRCDRCHFIEVEKPRHWLKKAYSSAIIDADTGIVSRSIAYANMTALIHLLYCKKNEKVLDYGGGYGITTRRLRDIGIDAYWQDKFAKNIFAKSFITKPKAKYKLVSAFELMEHLDNPIDEVKKIFKNHSPDIFIFSTLLHDGNPKKNWWYFAEDGGQHISFYTEKTLKILASKLNVFYSTDKATLHVFSKRKIPAIILKIIFKHNQLIYFLSRYFYKSKIKSDHQYILKNENIF